MINIVEQQWVKKWRIETGDKILQVNNIKRMDETWACRENRGRSFGSKNEKCQSAWKNAEAERHVAQLVRGEVCCTASRQHLTADLPSICQLQSLMNK